MTAPRRSSHSGKLLVLGLIVLLALAGYAFNLLLHQAAQKGIEMSTPEPHAVLTSAATGKPEMVPNAGFQGVDAQASPLAYHACFVVATATPLTGRYKTYADPRVTPGPRHLPCFDAGKIAAALKDGSATAYLGEADISYGIDRVVAVMHDGQAYAWNQLNQCGRALQTNQPLPEGCPPPPENMNAKLAH